MKQQRRFTAESLEVRICMTANFAAADFNTDFRVDDADIDLLVAKIASNGNDLKFDLTGDAMVSQSDLDYLIHDLLFTKYGDADLDRDVDFSDFLSVADGFGQTRGWAGGNFGIDATTSFADFLSLSANFGKHRSTVAYTYSQPDGNRYVQGWSDLPHTTPIDIPLEFVPTWVLGTRMFELGGYFWVAVSATGETQAFHVEGMNVSTITIDPLPAGTPPALLVDTSGARLLRGPADSSATTHAIAFGPELSWSAAIRNDGQLVVTQPDGSQQTQDVNAMLDGRILSDGNGRLLLLTDPTSEVPHGVLGDRIEANSVTLVDVSTTPWNVSKIETPNETVVEGIAPIWTDVNNDGVREVIVTLSSRTNGGQITIYEENGERYAQEPGIGRGSRWRHQLAVAPFGRDGTLQLVDVLTPHIGGVVEFRALGDGLPIQADISGNTSHVIGSRNLDMAVAADFDSDGLVELLLPNQRRTSLSAVSSTDSGAKTDWQLPIGGTLSTNVAAANLVNGRLRVAVGRSDKTLRIW